MLRFSTPSFASDDSSSSAIEFSVVELPNSVVVVGTLVAGSSFELSDEASCEATSVSIVVGAGVLVVVVASSLIETS